MSETSTAAPPSPPAEPAPREPRDRGGLLAYLIGHQSGVVILVALVISLLVGAALIRYQGVNPWFAYETLVREALVTPGAFTRTLQKTAPLVSPGWPSSCRCGSGCSTSEARASSPWAP